MTLVPFPLLFLIPVLPLLGALYAGLFGSRIERRWGHPAVYVPTVVLPFGSFAVVLVGLAQLLAGSPEASLYQRLWTWFRVGSLQVDMAFCFDHLSAVMCVVVTFVGSLIHLYSIGYMRGDPGISRFFSYLNLFLFFMLVLVLGDNLVLTFVGWEGVGLCSYLLIGFWYADLEKAKAGMKAFVVNRIGDAGFILGMGLLLSTLALVTENPSLRYGELESLFSRPEVREGLAAEPWLGVGTTTAVGLLLFLGAMGKSAQLPLHVWLPDAMAGPTPVSALIHAATMVTAGVYLLARMHFVYALSPLAMTVVAVVGSLTALFAATIGLFQHDIKKVLAYSTVSQLGFMFVALGAGAYWVAIFHLVTHALFKACLFLGSGSVILGCHHEQDMRAMGGLRRLMPITALTYLASCLAIAGFPLFSGFFSKDEILWQIFDTGNLLLPGGGLLPWALTTLAAGCTSYYVFRSYYMTFSGAYRGHTHAEEGGGSHESGHGAHVPTESPRTMTVPLVILGGLATVGGLLGLPELWHLPNFFENWLEPVFASSHHDLQRAGHGHTAEWGLMGLSVLLAITGLLVARWLYRDGKNPLPAQLAESSRPLLRRAHQLVYRKYYIDELYDHAIRRRAIDLARLLAWLDSRLVDGVVNAVGWLGRLCGTLQGFLDRWLVDGLVNRVGDTVITLGRGLRLLQTGRIQTYLMGLVAGSVLLVLLAAVIPW